MRKTMVALVLLLTVLSLSTVNAFTCSSISTRHVDGGVNIPRLTLLQSEESPISWRVGGVKVSRQVSTLLQSSSSTSDALNEDKLKIVVVGGGWAGYSVCESLSTNDNVEIILLDAALKASKGGLVEAGIHGFWREYRNTFDIASKIEGVQLDEEVLGEYSPSVLWSKNGKVAVAPVLLEDEDKESKPTALDGLDEESIRRFIAANLPPPLDLPILAELDNSNGNTNAKVNILDMMSGIGLLGAWADFQQESRKSWEQYDTQPASKLFEKAGITDALYEEFVSPLLHVLPMCPSHDCSAAAALSCFHVFALQSRGAFDVRWCKGSIAEKIFTPWQNQLEKRGVTITGGARVSSIMKNDHDMSKYTIQFGDEIDDIDCDAIVLAVGATSAGKIASSSPALSLEATKDFDKLRGVTCVAVRLFIKPNPTITSNLNGGAYNRTQLPPDIANAMRESPVSVCGAGIGGIQELEETGFCIYDLQRMHDEFSVNYYNNNNFEERDQVAVMEVDFFRADSFVDYTDDEIIDITLSAVSETFGTKKIEADKIIDATVIRARNAVSHFAQNSALLSPDVKLDEGMYIAGDWVDRTGHASWSTEKSVVTARQAADSLSKDFGLQNSQCDVIPPAKDTPQLAAWRQGASILRNILPPKTLPPSPWIFAKQLLNGEKEP